MQFSHCNLNRNDDLGGRESFGGNHNVTITFVKYICELSEIKMAYSIFLEGFWKT